MMCKQEGDLPSLFIPVVCLALLYYAATLLRSWGRGKEPGTSAPWEASWFRIRGVFLPLSCSGWCQPSRCPLDGMRGAKGTQPRAGELLVSRESFQAHLALGWHLEQAHAHQGWRQAVVGSSTCDGLAPLTWPQLSPFQEPPSLTGNDCVATQGSQTEA